MAPGSRRPQTVVMSMNSEPLHGRVESLLTEIRGGELSISDLMHQAVRLAPLLLGLCETHVRPSDVKQTTFLTRLMSDRPGQIFTTLLTDRAYRSTSKKRIVEQAQYLLRRLGMPDYVGPWEKVALQAVRSVGGWLPSLTASAMLSRIRAESSAFILPAGLALDGYLEEWRRQRVSVNVNHLGEEVLGEAEAERRVLGYVELLRRPGVETMSVKASSIASQLDAVAFESSVDILATRLGRILRAAQRHRRADGQPKMVVLDMEAYRDVDLTVEAFKRALSEPDLTQLSAGIALQTYLPETLQVFECLTSWASTRVQRGGAPVRIRLVKGANLATERVESSLRGWNVPVFNSKTLVDANFKRVLLAGAKLSPGAVKLGLASHNLFDVCFGLVLRSSHELEDVLSFELLHGMAEPLQRCLIELGVGVMVYAPIVGEQDFPSAIAYLVRRLDENTSAENYLRHSFGMRADSPAWLDQENKFRAACGLVGEDFVVHGRGADRREWRAPLYENGFRNEADTDFSFAGNREWLELALEDCRRRSDAAGYHVASRIGGVVCMEGTAFDGFDPSRPGVVPYRGVLATPRDVARAILVGDKACSRTPGTAERAAWLRAAAAGLRQARGELIALMVLDSGKRVSEADVEVSEAIDFADYYAETFERLESDARAASSRLQPRGLTVVAPPWNFPLAIPLGGVFAALISGNPVILKPAMETPLVAARACEILWNSGIPLDWLQLVIVDDESASLLITDTRIRTVVLTGGTSTARKFYEMRPDLWLLAETGGKNALYVSDMSDRELAISDAVRSAFGHAGQKCSALSQLILHREVFEDKAFRETLRDAVMSLKVGSAWDMASVVTPLISPPSTLQYAALTELGNAEEWLVTPRFDADNPRLVSPGIKWGVSPASPGHLTEYFCPLVSVLRADSLTDAIHIANGTSYGLTAGIHSLDEREHERFVAGVRAGNLYINRPITGAIVRRQPFGGWKDSSFGPGAKAGGPNYVGQFVTATRQEVDVVPRDVAVTIPEVPAANPTSVKHGRPLSCPPFGCVDSAAVRAARRYEGVRTATHAADSQPLRLHYEKWLGDEEKRLFRMRASAYTAAYQRHFAQPRDESGVLGEENVLRYRSLRELGIWVTESVSTVDLCLIGYAGALAECPLRWFCSPGTVSEGLIQEFAMSVVDRAPAPPLLVEYLERRECDRLRILGEVGSSLRGLANRVNIAVISGPLSPIPRLELIHLLREQAVSVRYHRYGHLGLREAPQALA